MAKIVEGNSVWKATIRCAQGTGFDLKVNGCFVLIEIETSDLKYTTDNDGDGYVYCKCPSCGMTIYPKWQLATIPSSVYERK